MAGRSTNSLSSTPSHAPSSGSNGSGLGGGFVVIAPAKRLNAEVRIAQLDAENKRLLSSIADFEKMKSGLEATIESLAGSLAGLDDLRPASPPRRSPATSTRGGLLSPVSSSSTPLVVDDQRTAELQREVERLRRQTEEGERAMAQLRDLSHAYAELAFRFLDDKAIIEFAVSHGPQFPGREYGGPSGGSMVLISLLNPTTRNYERLSNTEWRPSDTGADFKQRLRVTGGREGHLRVDVYETAAMTESDLWASAYVDLRTLLLTPPPYDLSLNLSTGRAAVRGGRRASLLLRPIRPGAAEPTVIANASTVPSTPTNSNGTSGSNTGANHPALVEAREQMGALKATLEHVIESMEAQRRDLADQVTRLEAENKQLAAQAEDYRRRLDAAERAAETAAINEGMAVAAEQEKTQAAQDRLMAMLKAEAGRDELRRINLELQEQRDAQMAKTLAIQQAMTAKENECHELGQRLTSLTAGQTADQARYHDEQHAVEVQLDQVYDLFSSLVDSGALVPMTIDDGRVIPSDASSSRVPESAAIVKVGKLRRLHSRLQSVASAPKGTVIPEGSVMVEQSELQGLRDGLAAQQKLAAERAEAEAALRRLLDQIAADRKEHAKQIAAVTDSYAALVPSSPYPPQPPTPSSRSSSDSAADNEEAIRQVARLRALLEPVTQAMARARDELASEQARIGALAGAARVSGERIAELERDVARLREQLTAAEEGRNKALEDVKTANAAKDAADAARLATERQLRDLEAELARVRQDHDAVTAALAELRAAQALSAADSEKQRMDAVTRLETEAATLRARIGQLENANRRLENEIEDMQRALEQVKEQNRKQARDADRAQAQADQDMREARDKLAELTNVNDGLNKKVAGMNQANEATTKQLADITVSYGRLVAVPVVDTSRSAPATVPELLTRLSTYQSSLASSQQALQDKLAAALAAKEAADRAAELQAANLQADIRAKDGKLNDVERTRLEQEHQLELQRANAVMLEGDRDKARGDAARARDELDAKQIEHAAALARAEEKRRDAMAQLEAHKEHLAHLQATNASAGTQAKSSADRLEREKAALQLQLASLQAKHDVAQERAERDKKAAARALRDVGDLYDTLIQPIGSPRSPLTPRPDTDHDQELLRLRATQRALVADHEARDQAKRDALLAVETRYAEADGDRRARAIALAAAQAELAELRAGQEKNDKQRMVLLATNEAQAQRIKDLEKVDKQQREQIAALQAERDRDAAEKKRDLDGAATERDAQIRQLQSRIDQLVGEATDQRAAHDRALEQKNKEHDAALQRLRDQKAAVETELDAQRKLTDDARAALIRAEEAHALSKSEMAAAEKARQSAATASEAERQRLIALQGDSARVEGERAAIARQVREVADMYAALSRAFPPPDESLAVVELGGDIDVSVSCRNLIKLDAAGKTDPLVTIEVEDQNTGEFVVRGRTEWQKNKINPDFKTAVRITGDAHLQVRFTVYDTDADRATMSAEDMIGSTTATIGELFRSQPLRRSLDSNVDAIKQELAAKKTIIIIQGTKPLTASVSVAVPASPAAVLLSPKSAATPSTPKGATTPGTPVTITFGSATPLTPMTPAHVRSGSVGKTPEAKMVDPSDELTRLRTMHRALAQSLEYNLAQQAAADKRRSDDAAAQTATIAGLRAELAAAATAAAALQVEKGVTEQRLADTLTAKKGVESSLEMATRELAALRESSTAKTGSLEAANREQAARIAAEQAASRARIEALENTEAQLRHQLAEQTAATADTQRRLVESKKQLEDAEVARAASLAALQSQLLAAQKRVAQVEGELAAQGVTVSELQKLIADQKQSIAATQEERDSAQAATTMSREAHEQTLNDLQGKLTVQQGVVSDLRGKLVAEEHNAAVLRSTLADRDATIQELTAAVEAARATQAETQSALVAAQASAAAQDAANAVADKASGERLAAMSRARAEVDEQKRAAEGALAAEQVRSAALEAKLKALGDELKAKNQEVDRVIVEQSSAVQDTDSRLKRAQEELTKARAQLALVTEQKRIVDDQLAEQQSSAAVIQQRLAAAELEAARAKEQLAAVEAERDQLRKLSSDQADKLARLQLAHASLERSNQQQVAEVERLTAEQTAQVAEADAKHKKANDDMAKLRSSLATLTEQRRAADEQLVEQQSTATGLRQRLLELETHGQRAREQSASLEGEVDALRRQLQDSVALATRQQSQLSMLDKAVAQQAAEIEELRRQLNEAQAAATGAEVMAKGYAERIAGLTATLKTKNEESAAQAATIGTLETRLTKQAEKITSILKQHADSDGNNNDGRLKLLAELELAKEQAANHLAELRKASRANDELNAQLDALQKRIAELERQHREALSLLAAADDVKGPTPPTELDITVGVRNVPRLDWLSKADPLVAIHQQNDDGQWQSIGVTNWLKNKENADFAKRLHIVCGDVSLATVMNRPLRVSLYDVPNGEVREDRLVGSTMIKMSDLLAKDGKQDVAGTKTSLTLSLDHTTDHTLSRRLKQKNTSITLTAEVVAVALVLAGDISEDNKTATPADAANLPLVVSKSIRRQAAARNRLTATAASLQSSNASLSNERNRLEAALRDAESRVRRAEMTATSTGGAAAEAQDQLAEQARERDTRLAALEAERHQSEAVLQQLIEEEQQKRSTVEGARAKLQADLQSSDDQLRALRVKLVKEEGNTKQLTNRVAELESEKQGLTQLLAAARAAAPVTPKEVPASVVDQSPAPEVRMLEMKVKNDHASKVNAQLEASLSSAQARVRTLEKTNDELQAAARTLESAHLAQSQEMVREVKRVTDALEAAAKKAEADGALPAGTTGTNGTTTATAAAGTNGEKKGNESEITYELVISLINLVARADGTPCTPMVALFEQATPTDRLLFVDSTERIRRLTSNDPVFEKRIVYKRQSADELPELLKLNVYDASRDELSPEHMTAFDRELLGSAVLSLNQIADGREAKLMLLNLDDTTISVRLRSSGTRVMIRQWHEADAHVLGGGETRVVAEAKANVTTQLARLNKVHRVILTLVDMRTDDVAKANALLDEMQKEMDENDKQISQWERTCLEWQEKANKSAEDVATLMQAMDEMEKAQAEGKTVSFASPAVGAPPSVPAHPHSPPGNNIALTAALAEVASWEAKWTDSEAKLLDTETKLAETEAKLHMIEGKYKANERKLAAMAIPRTADGEAAYLREEMDALRQRLESETSELEDKVKSLKKNINELESQQRKDRATIVSLQKENAALRARLGDQPIDYDGIDVKRPTRTVPTTPSRGAATGTASAATPTSVPTTPHGTTGAFPATPMSPAEDMEIELSPSIKNLPAPTGIYYGHMMALFVRNTSSARSNSNGSDGYEMVAQTEAIARDLNPVFTERLSLRYAPSSIDRELKLNIYRLISGDDEKNLNDSMIVGASIVDLPVLLQRTGEPPSWSGIVGNAVNDTLQAALNKARTRVTATISVRKASDE